MSTARILATSIAWVLISAPATSAQGLSKYREFQLGTSLVAVARQAGMAPEPRVLQQRPALIQELMWQPPPMRGSSPQGDSVKKVLFSFYNGQLFRIIVSYDRERTEGLTGDDMAEAISAKYGLATLPATQPLLPPVSAGADNLAHWQDSRHLRYLNYDDDILTRWGDSEYSVHLFRSSYQATFGLVMVSRPLDVLARAATVEAARLDEQEAPQRELDRQQKQTEDDRVSQATARRVNRATFRP
jgi:hypothetical protein